MKKLRLSMLLVLAMLTIFNTVAQEDYNDDEYVTFGAVKEIPVINADNIPYQEGPLNKLERGVINGATFWMELPAEVAKVSKEENLAMGLTKGVVHGTITGIVRGATALFDFFTFFVPSYTQPVMKPEYALTRCDDKMKELLW